MAAATAVHEARAGQRVLLVSTDQAHSLGDVLGVAVSPTGQRDPVRVMADLETGSTDAGGGSLDALAMDTLALVEARWRTVVDTLGRRFSESELGEIAPEELSALPGVQEVLGLHEVGELARCGKWDHIVVDCASTADALRMLTLPATVRALRRAGMAAPSPAFHRRQRRAVRRGGGDSLERISAMSKNSPCC